MAYSTQRAVSNGTLQLLQLSIDFFDKSEITVYLDSVPTIAFTWATSSSIRFNTPVPNGVEALIRRTTDLSSPRHVFSLGAQFKDSTLDDDFRQILHIAQEAVEGANVGDIYATLNMHGNKITNVGLAVDLGDAVSLGQVRTDSQSAFTAAAQAASSASSAAASLAGATAARDVTLTYRDTTQGYMTTALGYRDTTLTYKNAAEVSNLAAGVSAALASDWASKAEDSIVSGGLYSAYHYSRKASASATAANTSKVAAGVSETNAKTSETNAAGWAAGLNIPTAAGNGGKILAQKTNETGLEYKDLAGLLTDPWALQPIGVPIPLVFGAPTPPTTGSYRYVALDNDATYNSTFLSTVSITGADPLIVATAKVVAVGSPMDGATIRLINEERRFLRPGKAVTLEDSGNIAHNHGINDPGHTHGTPVGLGTSYTAGGVYGPISGGGGTYGAATGITIQNNGGSEARPRNMAVRYFMRIK